VRSALEGVTGVEKVVVSMPGAAVVTGSASAEDLVEALSGTGRYSGSVVE